MICMKPLKYFAEKDAAARFNYFETWDKYRKDMKQLYRIAGNSLFASTFDVESPCPTLTFLGNSELSISQREFDESRRILADVYEEQKENHLSNKTIIKKVARIIARDFLHKKNPNAYARHMLKRGSW